MPVHKTEYRVPFGDTDALGIVYYANYLRYFEVSRNEYFRDRVRAPLEMVRDDAFLIVIEAHVQYHSPARFDDKLIIDAWIPRERITPATFHFDYVITLEDTRRKIVSGHTAHAMTTREGKLKRMARDFRAIIDKVALDRPPLAE
ncbi:MAG: acyl-CoA thioesterase [Deltaproteobacteria bacterium]|nr:acyl-CoA thioesterase [Deltaproteobacteria bacterium]